MSDRYLEPHQSSSRPSTDFEDRLGYAIEAAYADGVHDLDGLVARLTQSGPATPDGAPWSAETFSSLLAELAR